MLSSSFLKLRGSARHRICTRCLAPQPLATFSSSRVLRTTEETEETLPRSPIVLKPLGNTESTKIYAKKKAAATAWAERADRIQDGKEPCLWDIFEERGLVKDVAGSREAIRELMRLKRIGAYVGIDPTAASLHLGHLVPLMPLFWMYMNGYTSITLLGSATAKVGDPSGRLTDREKQHRDVFNKNMVSMHYQIKKLWTNVDAMARRYGYKEEWAWTRGQRNNNEWWNKQPLLEFLQLLGSNVRVGPMLSRDTVKRKLTEGDGLSFAELTYTLMQGWDWWTLYKQLGVQMQIGGSDQFGNIVQGIEVVKTVRPQQPIHGVDPSSPLEEIVGFTTPLLTNSSGEKIGKSSGGGNLWLSNIKTSPYDLYGYFVRQPDEDMERMLKLFTFIPTKEISEILAKHETDKPKRVAQHRLAFEVIALVHGMDVAESTQVEHRAMHGKGSVSTLFTHDTAEQVLLNSAPEAHKKLPKKLMDQGNIARILFAAGLAKSVSDGHRLATQQAVYIGGREGQNKEMGASLTFVPVKAWFPEDTKNYLINGNMLILRKGKHDIRIVEFISDEEYEALGETYPGQPGTGRVRNMRELAKLRQSMAESVDGVDPSAAPSDSKLQALRKQLEFFEENFNPNVHNPKSHPDKIRAKIQRLEQQQKLFGQGEN
ncbi:hypothetical protein MCOR25_004025 [Pyricularia grisea]|uniref:Tyrosine--tRNA ligase n=1 Tax=Pyricularia grisea TaxID=148305 RepID=A0A6P8AWS0_PYRGI|nr:uncharacterized protein PgNI_08652 [Pyricularia grisea]KAI6371090.1 hypothetical protein MCOR25_004025 [Pyricularia grisea]TLD06676.1 hypothetical protein PgNI_08652 [Pyricularia grisea]